MSLSVQVCVCVCIGVSLFVFSCICLPVFLCSSQLCPQKVLDFDPEANLLTVAARQRKRRQFIELYM